MCGGEGVDEVRGGDEGGYGVRVEVRVWVKVEVEMRVDMG